MIRLKPLLETQLIREALPLSKAKKYVSLQQNPAIKASVDTVMAGLNAQEGAKPSRRGDRVAIPFRFEVTIVTDNEDLSQELFDFYNAVVGYRETANSYIGRGGPGLAGEPKRFPTFDGPGQLIQGQLPDQYNRPIKVSKYIKMLLAYKLKDDLDTIEIITKVNPDTGEKGIRKGNDEWTPLTQVHKELKQKSQEKINRLIQQYNEIPEVKYRQENKNKSYYMVFSKHAYDIAGMSTDRGWTSCMNLWGGSNNYYLQHDVEEGTIVVYLVAEDDLNITKPTARIAIKPYVNVKDGITVYYQAEQRVYGTAPDAFLETVNRILDSIQPGKHGLFQLIDTLYCDSKREIYKFSDPDIDSKVQQLIANREQASTVDEARYMLNKYMGIGFDEINSKIKFIESDKLYIDAPNGSFSLTKKIDYCPINIINCKWLTIQNMTSFEGFPETARGINIYDMPELKDFTGFPTQIETGLFLDGQIELDSFNGLKPGLTHIGIRPMYRQLSPTVIKSFQGIPATVNLLDIKSGVVLDMTIDEFVSQLKPIGLQRFMGFRMDLHSDFLDIYSRISSNPATGKLTHSIAKKIQSIPADTSLPEEKHQLSKTYRFLAWLLSELPTVNKIDLMNSIIDRGDIEEKWFPQNWQ